MFNIVLHEPEIPQNTGNISRSCAATGCALHLVHPLGFSLDDKHLKRAGLDYWDKLEIYHYDNFEHFEHDHAGARFFLASTHAAADYSKMEYREGDFLIFGKETAGLPKELLKKYSDTAIRIPMRENIRSLNLSNSVAIVLYEALRQCNFCGMS